MIFQLLEKPFFINYRNATWHYDSTNLGSFVRIKIICTFYLRTLKSRFMNENSYLNHFRIVNLLSYTAINFNMKMMEWCLITFFFSFASFFVFTLFIIELKQKFNFLCFIFYGQRAIRSLAKKMWAVSCGLIYLSNCV